MQHPDYHEIRKQFRRREEWTDSTPLVFAKEGVDLFYPEHCSENAGYLLGRPEYRCEEHGLEFPGEPTSGEPIDYLIEENNRFRYPLLREHGTGPLQRHHHVVILLHGLNERSFTKYIPWALQIWSLTGFPVILFPLTFHINRVRREWAREQHAIFCRRSALPGNEHAHRYNAVISERLWTHPERFIWGAIQSYWDIMDMVRKIREDRHPHFMPDARVDLLGFSAGGYVALTLLLENHRDYFRSSRGVMFASCAAVRDVNLASPLILDHLAEMALMKLHVKYREKLMNSRLKHWFEEHGEGRWLNAFCGLMPNRTLLDQRLGELAPRLLGIAGMEDQVMTPGAMMNALQGIRRDTGVRVLELPLGIHENPFACPDYAQQERSMITEFLNEERFGKAFEQFIQTACAHLTTGTHSLD